MDVLKSSSISEKELGSVASHIGGHPQVRIAPAESYTIRIYDYSREKASWLGHMSALCFMLRDTGLRPLPKFLHRLLIVRLRTRVALLAPGYDILIAYKCQ
jgi:hypothetical protein